MSVQRGSGASGPNVGPGSLQSTLDLIGGKWKGVLLYHLIGGAKRFNEIRRLCPGISQRMLTLQLRDLERSGLVHREVYLQVPRKVEYSLTEWGRGLETAILNIKSWGEAYSEEFCKEHPQLPEYPAPAGTDTNIPG
ncbi:helix-turn-helix domain-containing protein [Paenibacillus sp. S150]|uniref:winged helix-turn-helix transcriptional regulator n=1 Tax=Paenibacillus sp. S150 TaxID=2749826 RepID=UPI001C590E2D|nr:winged helix-turn-helix transcriptional regulator [Paenibacillus sp. S150]MBW4082093.1 winged helix-turn-helix transcriptional regulator [Paenibacillus sp. S150]